MTNLPNLPNLQVISVERIIKLAGSLGTAEGVTRVNFEIDSLSLQLMDPKEVFSRDELTKIVGALDTLSAAILAMDRVTRELLGQAGSGAVDCVG